MKIQTLFLSFCMFAVMLFGSKPVLSQNDSCSLSTVVSSFNAAALSGEVQAWAQRYADSDCSVTTKRGVNALVQAFNLIVAGASEAAAAHANLPTSGNTFDNDTEGWTFFNDATPIEWKSQGGDPDGNICSKDLGKGVWWYYEAPSSFTNSLATAYGLVLHFELKQARTDEQGDPADQFEDVFLIGAGQTLVYNTNYNPGATWTSYGILLTEYSGWTIASTGRPPTHDQMLNILEKATVLRIRGEYRSGEDSSCLDNVELKAN